MKKENQHEVNMAILESHKVVKNGVAYPSPAFYLNPILKELEESPEGSLIIEGTNIDEMVDKETNEKYIAYQRVSLIKEFTIDEELSYKIGFVYALDIGKPIIKVFTGANVHACTNLCVFGADKKQEFLILNNTEGAQLQVKNYIQSLAQDMKQAKEIIHSMKNTFFNNEETKKMLGNFLLNFSKVKNVAGTQCLLDAATLLTDSKSMYYFEEQTTAWNIYNAFTHNICNKKHILQQPEKVFVLYNEMLKYKNFAAETIQLQLN